MSSETTKTELLQIKPLSRFIERFDFSPPPELLEVVVDDSDFHQTDNQPKQQRLSRLIIQDPLISMYNKQQTITEDYEQKPKYTRKNMNRANVVIQRYESWNKFLQFFIQWINETMIRTTLQSEKTFSSILKSNLFFSIQNNTSANDIQGIIQNFTTELSLKEQKFVQLLRQHVNELEKFRKECISSLKKLRSRSDLSQEDFLKKAELTFILMTQLTKFCKEVRHTIEKGGNQVTNDPWLANLYVLRQLKKEIDEDNRLRKLMIPIQKDLKEFEFSLLDKIKDILKDCFEFIPNHTLLTKEKLVEFKSTLNQSVDLNWDTFVEKNKSLLTSEINYLNMNYPYKNHPFVLTLHKGQLQRKSGGVLQSKFITKYFVLTESGFLYQFKLNDKVSPEHTIYIPSSTIVPSIDISNLNQIDLNRHEQNKHYTFEIQRNGSVFRDKTYTFRTTTLEEMIIWCKFLHYIASRPLNVLLPKQEESTPPPSPIHYTGSSNKILLSDSPSLASNGQLDTGSSDKGFSTIEYFNEDLLGKHDTYVPKLNV